MSSPRTFVEAFLRRRLLGHEIHSFIRWFLVAFGSVLLGLGILYALVDGLKLPVWLGSIICAEIGTLIRFVLNEYFVFKPSGSLWTRIVKYHLANLGGYLIWCLTTNLIALAGAHYILSALIGMASSMTWSIATNFGWVWKATAPAEGITADKSPTLEQNAERPATRSTP